MRRPTRLDAKEEDLAGCLDTNLRIIRILQRVYKDATLAPQHQLFGLNA